MRTLTSLTPDHVLTEDLPPVLLCSFNFISIAASLSISEMTVQNVLLKACCSLLLLLCMLPSPKRMLAFSRTYNSQVRILARDWCHVKPTPCHFFLKCS